MDDARDYYDPFEDYRHLSREEKEELAREQAVRETDACDRPELA